jgi:D-Tyr-tRNAtyr deacylase
MKKLSFSLVFCLTLFSLSAQEPVDNWMQSEGTLEGFSAGSQYFTLVSDANLRDHPGTQSKVLAKLPIGTPVTVLSVSSDSLLLRGVKLPWVEVRAQISGSASINGYIWGGFLALASIQTPDEEYTPNRGVLYLTGVAAYEEEQHQLTIQVRVAQGGKELSKAEFTTHGDLSYYPSFNVDFVPFSGVKALISVNYYYPACGYPSGNNLLFWRENNQLDKVLETTSISEGGIFYDSEEYILPTEKGGIGDHILVVKDHSEFEEKGDDFVRSKQTYQIVVYKWTGSKLVKVKEIK